MCGVLCPTEKLKPCVPVGWLRCPFLVIFLLFLKMLLRRYTCLIREMPNISAEIFSLHQFLNECLGLELQKTPTLLAVQIVPFPFSGNRTALEGY